MSGLVHDGHEFREWRKVIWITLSRDRRKNVIWYKAIVQDQGSISDGLLARSQACLWDCYRFCKIKVGMNERYRDERTSYSKLPGTGTLFSLLQPLRFPFSGPELPASPVALGCLFLCYLCLHQPTERSWRSRSMFDTVFFFFFCGDCAIRQCAGIIEDFLWSL